jgi:sodium/proline symporter
MAFVAYAGLMVVLGGIGFRRVKTSSDYIIGGRSLGALVGALSAEASDMSAWLFMGLPGAIYIAGTGEAWIAVGLLLGTVCNWVFVAKKMRTKSQAADDSVTLPKFFAASCSGTDAQKKALRVLSSIIITLFFTVYTASGFVAGGKFFSYTFGTSYLVSMLITAAIVITYTFLGGFLSIAWTSVAQGILMVVAVAAVPIGAMLVLGGVSSALFEPAVSSAPVSLVQIVSNLAWGLGYFGMPHIIVKYMALKDTKTATRSGVIAIIWCAISLGFAVLIGVVGRAFIGGETLSKGDSENLFTMMIHKLFIDGGYLTLPFIAGLFFCAILSAIMSTAASQLLMASSSISVDIYAGSLKNGDVSDNVRLKLSRIFVVGIALLGFLIALNPENQIMTLVSNAWAGFGAAFGPLVLLVLYRERISCVSAIAGMVSGGLCVLVWPHLPAVSSLYELVPGFALSLMVTWVTSHTSLGE